MQPLTLLRLKTNLVILYRPLRQLRLRLGMRIHEGSHQQGPLLRKLEHRRRWQVRPRRRRTARRRCLRSRSLGRAHRHRGRRCLPLAVC